MEWNQEFNSSVDLIEDRNLWVEPVRLRDIKYPYIVDTFHKCENLVRSLRYENHSVLVKNN